MTATSHSDIGCVDFVLAVLDWLEGREESPASIDEVFALLSDQRRRLLLQVMRSYEEELTLPDAAEEVATLETGRSVVNISAECVADVYLSLYHDHLPRLVDAGLLEYDQSRDLVSPGAISS